MKDDEPLLVGRDILVVVIPSVSEEDIGVVPPVVLPSQERAVIPTSLSTDVAGSSNGSEAAGDLVWPKVDELGKVRFMLRDKEGDGLWGLLGRSGLSVRSNLAHLMARLKKAMEEAELSH